MIEAKIFKNGSRDPDHALLGVVCHPKAMISYSLPVHKIWRFQV